MEKNTTVTQLYYRNNQFVTLISNSQSRAIFRVQGQALAECCLDTETSGLMASDGMGSVLSATYMGNADDRQ